jgi:hypothetical protein
MYNKNKSEAIIMLESPKSIAELTGLYQNKVK